MNGWFDVPDSVGAWFGVRLIAQILVWFVVITTIVKTCKPGVLLEWIAASIVVAVLLSSGCADELLSVFAFLFGINPSGW
jgi:hypothetical protein